MSTPDRQELVRNAIAFLSDPKTQSSPLAQRIQFLEAKGLTTVEIEDALRQAPVNQTQTRYQPQYAPSYGPVSAPYPYYAQPQPNQWDWRDYFITAVISGTVMYGAISLFRKYLLPHLRPPSLTAYESDKDELTAQFDAAEALLKEIQSETQGIKAAVEEQREKVENTIKDIETVAEEMREGERKNRDSIREVREEVQNVRDMLPKMIDKTKESQSQSLVELQQELKSLKALLLNRGPSSSSATPNPISSPLPSLAGRPSIPAWQLAAAPNGSSSSGPALNLSRPSPVPAPVNSTTSRSVPPSVHPNQPQPYALSSTPGEDSAWKGKEVAPESNNELSQ